MIEQKLAEILCNLYCTDTFRAKCKQKWKGSFFDPTQCIDLSKSIKSIKSLIEEERKETH